MKRTIVLALFAIGCSESTVTSMTMTVTGRVTDFQSMRAIANATVCVHFPEITPKPCATTAADGSFTIDKAPSGIEAMMSVTAANYYSLLAMGTLTATKSTVNATLPTVSTANALGIVVSVDIDNTKGQLVFIANTGVATPDGGMAMNAANVGASLSSTAARGPFFASTAGIPDTSLMKTTTSGFGAFLNAPPGDHELTLSPPSGITCTADYAWVGSKANAFKVRLAAGFITGIIVTCR